MNKSLIGVFALLLTLPLACSAADTPPDPLAKRSGFCDAWAAAACQTSVVDACNANSAESCQAKQSDFCLGIIPEQYSSKHAKECLSAVKAAYKDAKLTPEDIAIVIQLGAPCDQLSKGTRADGQSCTAHDDCNTDGGFNCIMKQGATKGVCAKPAAVGPGEACDGPAQVCGDGNFCNGENCVAYKKTGVVCDGDYQCKPEDHCVIPADAASGACDVRLQLNEVCTSSSDCQSGYCAVADGQTEGECAATIVLTRTEPLCLKLR